MRIFAPLLLAGLLASTLSCAAGGVSGEVDGERVPLFFDTAFGFAENNNVLASLSLALPSGSCEGGEESTKLLVDGSQTNDADEQRDIIKDQADLINERIPKGSWWMSVFVVALDDDALDDEDYDLEDNNDAGNVFLSVCEQKREAELDENPDELDNGADCYVASEGELTLILADDESSLRVTSDDDEVELHDEDGDDVGDVVVDITFRACEGISDELEPLVGD